MRLCLLGNSHLAAVRDAWRASDTADVEAVFVGAARDLLGELTVADRMLRGSAEVTEVMRRMCGANELKVDEFDAFALVGLRFEINKCCQLFATHRTWRADLPDSSADVQLVSRECLSDATKGKFEQTIAVSLARELRAVTTAPIAIVPQPGLSEMVLEDDLERRKLSREIHALGYGCEIREIFAQACAALSGDFEILGQPPETIVHDIFTRREYCLLSKLPKDPTRHDVAHMNVKYGHLVISQLLSCLPGTAVLSS